MVHGNVIAEAREWRKGQLNLCVLVDVYSRWHKWSVCDARVRVYVYAYTCMCVLCRHHECCLLYVFAIRAQRKKLFLKVVTNYFTMVAVHVCMRVCGGCV